MLDSPSRSMIKFSIKPSLGSLVGSPKTPYIFDDRCSSEDAAEKIKELYDMSKNERKNRGKKGREWALGNEAGFTSKHQADRFIDAIEETLNNFTPKNSFTFTSDSNKLNKVLNHKLIY